MPFANLRNLTQTEVEEVDALKVGCELLDSSASAITAVSFKAIVGIASAQMLIC